MLYDAMYNLTLAEAFQAEVKLRILLSNTGKN